MSKLDYLTIGIVVVCIAAIIFLIVKISGLMNDDQPGMEPNRIESALGNEEKPAEDTSRSLSGDSGVGEIPGPSSPDDPDDEEVEYYDPVGEENRFEEEKTESATKPGEVAPGYSDSRAEELTPRSVEKTPDNTGESKAGTINKGKYMVLAGSFRYKNNAEQMISKLKKLGYREAELGYTNRGAYAVALVNRFDDLSAARSLVTELESKHDIEAIIKTEE